MCEHLPDKKRGKKYSNSNENMLFWRKTDETTRKSPLSKRTPISTNPLFLSNFFEPPLCPNFKNKKRSNIVSAWVLILPSKPQPNSFFLPNYGHKSLSLNRSNFAYFQNLSPPSHEFSGNHLSRYETGGSKKQYNFLRQECYAYGIWRYSKSLENFGFQISYAFQQSNSGN